MHTLCRTDYIRHLSTCSAIRRALTPRGRDCERQALSLEQTKAPPLNILYIYDLQDPTKFDPILVAALGYAMGAELAAPITQSAGQGGQMPRRGRRQALPSRASPAAQDPQPREWDVDVLLQLEERRCARNARSDQFHRRRAQPAAERAHRSSPSILPVCDTAAQHGDRCRKAARRSRPGTLYVADAKDQSNAGPHEALRLFHRAGLPCSNSAHLNVRIYMKSRPGAFSGGAARRHRDALHRRGSESAQIHPERRHAFHRPSKLSARDADAQLAYGHGPTPRRAFRDGPYLNDQSRPTRRSRPRATAGTITITASATTGINNNQGFLSQPMSGVACASGSIRFGPGASSPPGRAAPS
jgi:hypothetical protein